MGNPDPPSAPITSLPPWLQGTDGPVEAQEDPQERPASGTGQVPRVAKPSENNDVCLRTKTQV